MDGIWEALERSDEMFAVFARVGSSTRSFTQSPKMPAPTAPAAPNNNSRPTAPATLGAAPVGVVKTGAVTEIGSEALAVLLVTVLPPVEVASAPASEPLELPVWEVTSPVASSSSLASTVHVNFSFSIGISG